MGVVVLILPMQSQNSGSTHKVSVPTLTSGGAGIGPQVGLAPEFEPFIPAARAPSSLWGGRPWLL